MSPPKRTPGALAKLDRFRHEERNAAGEDGAAPSATEEAPPTGDTARILEAVSLCQTTLTSKIEEVKIDISLIRQDIHKLRERVSETERRIGQVEDDISPLQVTTERLQYQLNVALSKQDDMENRLRRCNLRFVGLPEKAEGSDPPTFLENLLINNYGREAFSSTFVVERAHRLAARPPAPGAPPRTFIAKLLNYRDRDTILRLTREKGNIPFEDKHVAVYPDFSAEVQRKRAQFTEAKRQLRSRHLPYAMLFPARLRVIRDGKAHFFEDPSAIISWLERQDTAAPP